MDLNALRLFVRVAELGSFTQAAEQLGMAKGRVSAVIQRLESTVGVRLLHRTTRHVRLSADGEQFLERCKELVADADQLQTMFQPATRGVRGRVRIDMPTIIATRLIIPHLPDLLALHPQLEVSISTTDRRVDLVQEGFDCVLRIGPLADTELVARPLGLMAMCNLASPAYLAKHGTPTSMADLAQHRLIHYASKLTTQGAGWEYQLDGAVHIHPMRCPVIVNGTDAYQAACVAGLGLIQAPVHGSEHLVAAGLLVKVMPQLTAAPMQVSLLYPHRRQVAPRVQAVLQWITALVQPGLTSRS